jgi:hypothetical protein
MPASCFLLSARSAVAARPNCLSLQHRLTRRRCPPPLAQQAAASSSTAAAAPATEW